MRERACVRKGVRRGREEGAGGKGARVCICQATRRGWKQHGSARRREQRTAGECAWAESALGLRMRCRVECRARRGCTTHAASKSKQSQHGRKTVA